MLTTELFTERNEEDIVDAEEENTIKELFLTRDRLVRALVAQLFAGRKKQGRHCSSTGRKLNLEEALSLAGCSVGLVTKIFARREGSEASVVPAERRRNFLCSSLKFQFHCTLDGILDTAKETPRRCQSDQASAIRGAVPQAR